VTSFTSPFNAFRSQSCIAQLSVGSYIFPSVTVRIGTYLLKKQ
jgi:hypothetical protein